jgi:ADP-L-glycero-D-manno-heptose 6-epimerase
MSDDRSASHPLLVTGAAGFIGARFVERCNRLGVPVVSVDVSDAFGRDEHRGLDFGRCIDRDAVADWLRDERPSLRGIVHLGACSDTTELDEAFLERVNVGASRTLWRHACSERLPFVYASSAATYGDGGEGFADDEAAFERLRPLNPYGESKRRFDLWVLEEERAGRTPPSWSGFKFFNVYGFGERHKGAMASVVVKAYEQIARTGRVTLFRSHKDGVADGHQSRDFVYVEDVVDVLWFALEQPIRRGVYNLGTGQARTFLDLARAVFAALDAPEAIDWVDTPVAIRDRYQYFTEATMERLRQQGYAQPFTSLEDGVRATIERLRSFESVAPER